MLAAPIANEIVTENRSRVLRRNWHFHKLGSPEFFVKERIVQTHVFRASKVVKKVKNIICVGVRDIYFAYSFLRKVFIFINSPIPFLLIKIF